MLSSPSWPTGGRLAFRSPGRGAWRTRRQRSVTVLRLSERAKESIGPISTKTSVLGVCCKGYQHAHPSKARRKGDGPDTSSTLTGAVRPHSYGELLEKNHENILTLSMFAL